MFTFALSVAYVGTAYHGWQLQPNLPTIQGQLEQAVSKIADEAVQVAAAGSTDSGVHATNQIVRFQTNSPRDPQVWLRGLNGLTPADIQINWVRQVEASFHPRYAALSREYTYLFADTPAPDVLGHERTWQVKQRLDADLMHRAGQALIGEQDFSSFRGAQCQSITPMRRVNRLEVRRHGDVVAMTIEANAFVLHMVRNIAAGLVEASERQQTEHLAHLLRLRDRTALGVTAPAAGLYFTGVDYLDHEFPPGPKPTVVRLS